MRNPGYGHPMRPEYVLTDAGLAAGAISERLLHTARSLDIESVALQKWSLPVVRVLGGGANRFRAIQADLAPVTARALSLTLKDLGQAAVLSRRIEDGYPPTSLYALTKPGRQLAGLAMDLGEALPATNA